MNSSSPTLMDADTLMAHIRAEVARRKRATAPSEIDASIHEPIQSIGQIVLSPLPLPNLPKPQFAAAERFHLNDFLALHDQDFVDAAYRGVLKRGADVQGGQHFLASLRNGALSKIEILGRLRYSPEGRRRGVPVKGLLPAFAIQHAYRLPLIGGVVAFAIALLRLPRIARNLQGLEGYQHQRNAELESAIRNLAQMADANDHQLRAEIDRNASGLSELTRRIDAASTETTQRVESISGGLRTQLELAIRNLAQTADANDHQLRAEIDRNASGLSELTRRIDAASTEMTQHVESISGGLRTQLAEFSGQIESTTRHVATSEARSDALEGRIVLVESHKQVVDRQLVDVVALSQQASGQLASTLLETLGVLEQRVDGLSKTLDFAQANLQSAHLLLMTSVEGRGAQKASDPDHAASRFDKLYFAFEQRFRGSREDIRQRLSYYLPMLHESVAGKDGATVLDVGCGRGEWLELLRDEKILARGIDINESMAQECVKRGLDVDVGDAIAKLRQLPDNAFGALTGFQIIEHVSLDALIELIEQAHRVVQPGGLVIFETPNPENVVVGACDFYTDPTHQRPLPPVLMQFLVEAGGFADVAIHRVNANLLPQVFEEPGEDEPPALRTTLNYLRSAFLCAPDYSVVGRVA